MCGSVKFGRTVTGGRRASRAERLWAKTLLLGALTEEQVKNRVMRGHCWTSLASVPWELRVLSSHSWLRGVIGRDIAWRQAGSPKEDSFHVHQRVHEWFEVFALYGDMDE